MDLAALDFQNPEFSQRGSPPFAPPVAFRCLPLPLSHKTTRLTENAKWKRPLATMPLPTRPRSCLLALRGRIGTQPQRDVLRLHRLPYHPHQIVAQGIIDRCELWDVGTR